MVCEDLRQIHLAYDKGQWLTVLNKAINIWFSSEAGINSFIS
jgi:hypothetical protein